MDDVPISRTLYMRCAILSVAANDLVGKSDAEVREAIGDKFPKR